MQAVGFVGQDAHHVVGARQAAAHADVQDTGCALVVQLVIQGADVLRQGQGSLGQLGFEEIVDLIGVDFHPITEFTLAGYHAQGYQADIILRQLLVQQIAGGIRHQRNALVADLKHAHCPPCHQRHKHYKPAGSGKSIYSFLPEYL